jgi:DNA helicase HerA-like ATPase
MRSPRLYAIFLLWMLSELFEQLPEVGNPDKPKLVFFFEEAHLLFNEAPKALLDKIEQVVKLVRSKGVGVYFVTQNPMDIPESVLAQLGNRIQHALRAYTPKEQRAVRSAAESFRPNPEFSTAEVITQLGTGEALVSVLEEKGIPSIVGRTLIRPPSSRMGPLTPQERTSAMATSPVAGKYDEVYDRESAYELLDRRAQDSIREAEIAAREEAIRKAEEAARKEREKASTPRRSTRQSPAEAALNQFARTAAREVGNAVVRNIMGMFKAKR